jgi:hypothetical protein
MPALKRNIVMGLDMFLSAKRYMWYNETELANKVGAPLDLPEGIQAEEVSVKAAYWRKANAIHKWFVDNVQDGKDDCESYRVERDQLLELIDICKQIQADSSLAEELLPTRSGFFFGSTEIDEYYMHDINSTVIQLERALTLDEMQWTFEYYASW